jgi:hypothetical protein
MHIIKRVQLEVGVKMPSAESAGQHSPGWRLRSSRNPGLTMEYPESPARARQKPASPLQGFPFSRSNPGLRPLCGLRPGLCCVAPLALLTRTSNCTLIKLQGKGLLIYLKMHKSRPPLRGVQCFLFPFHFTAPFLAPWFQWRRLW